MIPEDIEAIKVLLASPKNIAIIPHRNPDGDALGSTLGLSHYLNLKGHSTVVISPNEFPDFLSWMPGSETVKIFEKDKDSCTKILDEADVIFTLDFNHLGRTGDQMEEVLEKADALFIMIDHHQKPDTYAKYTFSDTSYGSTCEMVYDFIVASGHQDRIDETIGECIYAGVVSDTGSFRFPSAHSGVHTLVADLKSKGLQHSKVHENLFDNFLENKLRFTGHVLLHRMEVMYEYNTALIAISKNDLLKYYIKTGDTEGLVNFPQSIQGIKLVGLVIDRDEERKWSFRSKGDFDCNAFARKYFNGGGHFNASGGRSSDSLEITVQRFKEAVKENRALLQ